MQIEFTVPGEPFGKQRPRHSRVSGTTYTPRETKLHEQLIQHRHTEDLEVTSSRRAHSCALLFSR